MHAFTQSLTYTPTALQIHPNNNSPSAYSTGATIKIVGVGGNEGQDIFKGEQDTWKVFSFE